jgi:hypothetical protein
MAHVHIGFDGLTVAIRSEIDEVIQHVSDVFDHMIVESGSTREAEIEVWTENSGFTLRSDETHQYPGTPLEHFLPLLKETVRVHFMKARRDLLWMHAAAVAKSDSGVLIAAPSGQGKSTISTLLADRGWEFLSDDVAPVSTSNAHVIPFPMRPVRRTPSLFVVADDDVNQLPRESVSIRPERIRRQPAQLSAIVVIAYKPDTRSSLSRLAQGTGALEVLRNLTNFVDHKSGAVSGVAQLARRLPIYMLSYSDRNEAVSLVDQII